MTIQKIIKKYKEVHPEANEERIQRIKEAYEIAKEAHKGQKRATGEPYIIHPLETAWTLTELGMGSTTIAAGLLHDVSEESSYSIKDIEQLFGHEITMLVDGVTKLGTIEYRGIERYVENLRKMFVAMAKDIRVIIIRLADRHHNLKTLYALPKEKQLRIAKESLEIYAPIANRLGIGIMKGRIEDLAFKHVHPKEYSWLKKRVSREYTQKENYLKRVSKKIEKELKKTGINPISIHGRSKHLYSLYKKLNNYNQDFSKIHDLVALRIVVNTVPECYAALGIVHNVWAPLKGRIKDYISQPKPNRYQSLHTTVFCEDETIVEFQIRTAQMHEEAEYGVTAKWHYDEKGDSCLIEKRYGWIKDLPKWPRTFEDRKKYLESLKIEVFQNRIFVFTPQGDVLDLPEEATPIDFAYHIHTEVGNKCIGVRINDLISSLDTQLKSGDVVDIITDKNRKGPNPDWLKFVKTNSTRIKIKNELKMNIMSLLKNVITSN